MAVVVHSLIVDPTTGQLLIDSSQADTYRTEFRCLSKGIPSTFARKQLVIYTSSLSLTTCAICFGRNHIDRCLKFFGCDHQVFPDWWQHIRRRHKVKVLLTFRPVHPLANAPRWAWSSKPRLFVKGSIVQHNAEPTETYWLCSLWRRRQLTSCTNTFRIPR